LSFRSKIRFDIAHSTRDVIFFFSHRRDVMKGGPCRPDSCKPGDNPGGEIEQLPDLTGFLKVASQPE
jgi:hypothetical protein